MVLEFSSARVGLRIVFCVFISADCVFISARNLFCRSLLFVYLHLQRSLFCRSLLSSADKRVVQKRPICIETALARSVQPVFISTKTTVTRSSTKLMFVELDGVCSGKRGCIELSVVHKMTRDRVQEPSLWTVFPHTERARALSLSLACPRNVRESPNACTKVTHANLNLKTHPCTHV